MRNKLAVLLFLAATAAFGQIGDFPFGAPSMKDMTMKEYAADPGAEAVYLREFGSAWISHEYMVIFEHHILIKVLKEGGKDNVDQLIYLPRNGNVANDEARLASLQAATYNLEGSSIQKSVLELKDVLVEKTTDRFKTVKVVFPNVRVGSVVELIYRTESPYLYQFQGWTFQHDIPAVYSEFWGKIPYNFSYNVTLRGFHPLKAQKLDRVLDCFPSVGTSSYDKTMGECSLGKYVMTDVPAFDRQEYLSSDEYYRSSIRYELSEYVDMTGAKVRYTETWKDVYERLKEHEYFGVKLKRGRKFMEAVVPSVVRPDMDELTKAKAIVDHVSDAILWNRDNDKYAYHEIKKVYEERKGNAAEVNLTMIAALEVAGLKVTPVLVSTRDNGVPEKTIPQRTAFNYVLARVTIDGKEYLLDATDPALDFGMIPFRCQNGQGLLHDPSGTWISLGAGRRSKTATRINLDLSEKGVLTGTVAVHYHDYAALKFVHDRERRNPERHLAELQAKIKGARISNYKASTSIKAGESQFESFDVEFEEPLTAATAYFTPFVLPAVESNPFKKDSRLYPVDYGVAQDVSCFVALNLPAGYAVEELPANNLVTLPGNSGKVLINCTSNGNKVTLNYTFTITKQLFMPAEYPALKAFYDKVIALQGSMVTVKKLESK